jgi:hypothetical protein
VIEMLFDRTKLHESRLFTLVISGICRTSCRKSALLFQVVFANVATASLAGMMVVGWA